MARKGRARRFREARELKQGFDDGMFRERGGSLADVDDEDAGIVHLEDDEAEVDAPVPWDPDEEYRRDSCPRESSGERPTGSEPST